jgi:hypothetical protein
VVDAGLASTIDQTNGAIGSSVVFDGPRWFTGIQDDVEPFYLQGSGLEIYNYIKTNDDLQPDFNLDPKGGLRALCQNFEFVPYALCDYRATLPTQFVISPAWQNTSNPSARQPLRLLNNVDIVYTSDKSKWSRCVVVETASPVYSVAGGGFPAIGGAAMFDLRKSPSVGKDANATGGAVPDGDGQGMGWFPGYAVDVETGTRLNIFFGENSSFSPDLGNYNSDSKGINADMIWNPSSQRDLFVDGAPVQSLGAAAYTSFLGGQHYVYVTNTKYDSCTLLRDRLSRSGIGKVTGMRTIMWAGMPVLTEGSKLKSYKDGLIPAEAVVKLRVNNPYAFARGKEKKGYPLYSFEFKGKKATALEGARVDSALNMVNVVPNPYYAYSAYEISEFSNTVKITNLPRKATVTIYTIDGKFIRQFKRDESPLSTNAAQTNAAVLSQQIVPAVEWDLKNGKGIPISSGVYLIHIDAPEFGQQRTLKFFALNRQFDPSRL